MNKIIVFILIIFVLSLCVLPIQSYALGEIMDGVKNFKDSAVGKSPIDIEEVKPISDTIFNTFQIIGAVIAFVVIVVLGIQFMTGSLETKAKIKESLIPLIVGLAVIFGGFTIWKIIVDLMQNAT